MLLEVYIGFLLRLKLLCLKLYLFLLLLFIFSLLDQIIWCSKLFNKKDMFIKSVRVSFVFYFTKFFVFIDSFPWYYWAISPVCSVSLNCMHHLFF
jgi:hypothetical protein